MSTLFTNYDFMTISTFLINEVTDDYYTINIYNPSLPIKYDPHKNVYNLTDGYEENPLTGISWPGAMYISRLLGGRLLTEKEWEYYAAGGKENLTYPWGNETPSPDKANYGEMVGDTTPVKKYAPNFFGLYDMAGNVEEWCLDNYHPEHKDAESNLSYMEKTIKGGCWNKGEELLSISSRRGKWYKIGTVGIGFRIVWEDLNQISETGDDYD